MAIYPLPGIQMLAKWQETLAKLPPGSAETLVSSPPATTLKQALEQAARDLGRTTLHSAQQWLETLVADVYQRWAHGLQLTDLDVVKLVAENLAEYDMRIRGF